MNVERTSLEARVARHAALADPSRLRIVDLLSLGDHSPTELQARVGLSSSLLAHHLNLLENHGIIRRTKSEADGRRSYVRLIPGALDDLHPDPLGVARRVMFVCRANSARSQLAAALWSARSTVPAASAGTHPAAQIDPGALAAAERHGLTLRSGRPTLLADVWDPDDYVITVCDTAHEELGAHEELAGPSLHWSVPDPVRAGTPAAFDAAYDELVRRVDELAPRLTAA